MFCGVNRPEVELSKRLAPRSPINTSPGPPMDDSENPGVQIKGGNAAYVIPKKEGDAPDVGAKLPDMGHASVMANAYANFMPASHAYQTGVNYTQWANQQNPAAYYPPGYCPYVVNFKADAGQSGSLKRPYEEPKTNRTYRDSFSEVNDPSLPKELTAMFQPLYCKLCSAQLSSNVMAKTHYRSKNHEKKVRRFLIEHSEKTGEPLHKRAKVKKAQTETQEYEPRNFHCEDCDLPLTGKAHAESHYMGKNHQRVIMGKRPPAGRGFYNDEGRWIRTVQNKTAAPPAGQDGFGVDFLPVKQQEPRSDNTLHCETCNVSVTSVPQMEMHLQGQKHHKKLKQQQQQQPGVSPVAFNNGEQPSAGQNGEVSLAKSIVFPANQNDMLSSYRTPSGQYYCKACNLSLNSEMQFVQHLNSKKHLKKSN